MSRRLSFGPFEANLASGELKRNGVRLRLQAQPFQLLALLLQQPGELVTREEVCHKLRPADTFVDFDRSLGTPINKIAMCLEIPPRILTSLRPYLVAGIDSWRRLFPSILKRRYCKDRLLRPPT
jgi:DNA-binding response OmpR family regulator